MPVKVLDTETVYLLLDRLALTNATVGLPFIHLSRQVKIEELQLWKKEGKEVQESEGDTSQETFLLTRSAFCIYQRTWPVHLLGILAILGDNLPIYIIKYYVKSPVAALILSDDITAGIWITCRRHAERTGKVTDRRRQLLLLQLLL